MLWILLFKFEIPAILHEHLGFIENLIAYGNVSLSRLLTEKFLATRTLDVLCVFIRPLHNTI